MAGVAERLASARSAVEQACHLLLTPTPAILDQCFLALSLAIGELAASRDLMAPFQGDSGGLALEIVAEVRQIQSKVSLAGRLLESAATYHSKWNRILVSMLEGYTAHGDLPTVARPGRLAVEG